MGKGKALKLAIGVMSTAFFLSVPSVIARADSFISSEQGIAGISAVLENTTVQEVAEAYNASVPAVVEETKSPYENLGVSTANNYVNIRKDPSLDSEVVGKLYRGCAADILDTLDGGWVKIKSGDVEGYIAMEYLAIGEEAESMVDKYATKWATVINTPTLRVRSDQSTDSSTLTLIPEGETYVVKQEFDDWAEILLGNDEDTGSDFTGYASKDYLSIRVEFKYAISIEEENRIKKEQEEAERAEAERKAKLAQEEAERKEAARKAAEAAKQNDANSSSKPSSSSTAVSTGGTGSASEIVSYALKFVGNRYVWGGTSLTHGADCSGFVQAVYEDFGYYIPRTSREQAASAGKKVSESEIQPGDLIFYANSSGTVNHVAMYIGNGKIVHAANSRQGIITSQYKYRDIYCIRRIVN